MFKRTRRMIEEMIRVAFDAHISGYHPRIDSPPCCEVCGCLVDKGLAVRGKPEIRERRVWGFMSVIGRTEEYIYTPYYCRVHAPKDEKVKK